MKLPELFQTPPNIQHVSSCLLRAKNMPPLDTKQVQILSIIDDEKDWIKTPTCGDGTLVVKYKGKAAALNSITEQANGEEWMICQLQGVKSKVSYRVTQCLSLGKLFGKILHDYASHPQSSIRRIVMPILHNIDGIDTTSLAGHDRYTILAGTLGMRYSQEESMLVVDIK